ncbi:MAG: AtpZ/AtpI family protein [Bacteroidales bacterium]|nr:AtpZ/AtpI family protein [Bacteroidales bacterium]
MNNQHKPDPLHNFAKYTSIAMQMMVVICLFCFAGYKCDQWIGWRFPLFTIVLSLSGVCIGIYLSVKDFLQKKDKK